MKKQKVLTIVAALPGSGGVATVVYALQNELNKGEEIENDVVVIKYYDTFFKKIIKKLRGEKIYERDQRYLKKIQTFQEQKITVVQLSSPILRVKDRANERIRYLQQLFELESYDIIHTHYYKDYTKTALTISALYHNKVVLTLHGSDTLGLSEKDISYLNQIDQLTYASNFLQQTVTAVGKITTAQRVIPNGYNDRIFNLRNLDSARMNIAYCGSLSDIKGVDALKIIFGEIAQKCPEYQLQIYGDGPKRTELQTFFQQHNLQVTFFGNVNQQELSDAFQKMRILILPSKREGYPCIVQEAKACGVYVIATNVGGTAEAIGTIGTLVNRDESFELEMAAKIIECLHDETLVASIIAKNYLHNWQMIAEQYLELYQELGKIK